MPPPRWGPSLGQEAAGLGLCPSLPLSPRPGLWLQRRSRGLREVVQVSEVTDVDVPCSSCPSAPRQSLEDKEGAHETLLSPLASWVLLASHRGARSGRARCLLPIRLSRDGTGSLLSGSPGSCQTLPSTRGPGRAPSPTSTLASCTHQRCRLQALQGPRCRLCDPVVNQQVRGGRQGPRQAVAQASQQASNPKGWHPGPQDT